MALRLRGRKDLSNYQVQPPSFTNRETETQRGKQLTQVAPQVSEVDLNLGLLDFKYNALVYTTLSIKNRLRWNSNQLVKKCPMTLFSTFQLE